METIIYITRHGESIANKTGTFTGSTNVPLSELGRKQAQKICEFLEDKNIVAIYSSPLSRAVDTVSPLGEKIGKQVIADDRFIELHFGRWEGKEKSYLSKNDAEFNKWCKFPLLAEPTEGETAKFAAERFIGGMDELVKKHEGKSFVISAHGGIILSVMCGIGYLSENASANDIPRNASVTKLIYRDGKYSVEYYAYEEYLKELKADFKYV
ncbi:MAG: histidine phosphatase family protein [Clostridia bacterium]|nr:histidine phosphatase family protein [Clostridia bacterium]